MGKEVLSSRAPKPTRHVNKAKYGKRVKEPFRDPTPHERLIFPLMIILRNKPMRELTPDYLKMIFSKATNGRNGYKMLDAVLRKRLQKYLRDNRITDWTKEG